MADQKSIRKIFCEDLGFINVCMAEVRQFKFKSRTSVPTRQGRQIPELIWRTVSIPFHPASCGYWIVVMTMLLRSWIGSIVFPSATIEHGTNFCIATNYHRVQFVILTCGTVMACKSTIEQCMPPYSSCIRVQFFTAPR
jgi:hypothetical protein